MLPDCGVLATPKRPSILRDLAAGTNSPKEGLPWTSPSQYGEGGYMGIIASSGNSISFYKPTASLVSPVVRQHSPVPVIRRGSARRRLDGINKGVGHNIRKPKIKAKHLRKNQAKVATCRLRDVKMPPSLPHNRSPKRSPGKQKRRHQLLSPGLSLLEDADSRENLEEEAPSKAKFITSRSRNPAMVKISKSIRLSAKYGDISLIVREGGFEKKNIGRQVEKELEESVVASSKSVPVSFTSSLPSVIGNSVIAPTRVPGTPSPKKPKKTSNSQMLALKPLRSSPRRQANISLAAQNSALQSNQLLEKNNTITPKPNQSSPCKSFSSSPSKGSYLTMTPTRSSPRLSKQMNKGSLAVSPCHMLGDQGKPCATPNKTPGKSATAQQGRNYDAMNILTVIHNQQENDSSSPGRAPKQKSYENSVVYKASVQLSSSNSETERCSPVRKSGRAASFQVEMTAFNNNTPKKCMMQVVPADKISSPQRNSSVSHSGPKMFVNDFNSDLEDFNQNLPLEFNEDLTDSVAGDGGLLSQNDFKQVSLTEETRKMESSTLSGGHFSNKCFPIFDSSQWFSFKSPEKKRVSSVKRKLAVKSDASQMIIDAGQKIFGAIQCDVCGLLYEVGDPREEESHQKYHAGFQANLKYLGWKNERLVTQLDNQGGRIIKVLSSDPVHWWRKVEEVLEVVDRDLGFSEPGVQVKEKTAVFMYVLEKKIVGCLVAEMINRAHRIIKQQPLQKGGSLVCCSEETFKTWIGISRIWVLLSYRKMGIGTALVDAMRSNMFNHYYLTDDDFAFSDPTESGMGFAEKYTKKKDFLVYRRNWSR